MNWEREQSMNMFFNCFRYTNGLAKFRVIVNQIVGNDVALAVRQ